MTSLIWRQQSWSKYQIRDSFFYQIHHAIPTINKINQSIASWRTKIRSQICAQKEGWWYWHLSYFALYWRIGFCKTEKLISKVNTSFLIPERFVIMSACTWKFFEASKQDNFDQTNDNSSFDQFIPDTSVFCTRMVLLVYRAFLAFRYHGKSFRK